MSDEFTPVENLLKNLDFSALPQPDIVPESVKQMHRQHEQFINSLPTYEDRIKPLTDRMDNMQSELESQTEELQKLRYENMKLNAQIEVLNKTNDKQLNEISELKENDIVSKKTIQELNQTIEELNNGNKFHNIKNFVSGIIVTVVGGIILWYITTLVL